MTNPIAQVISGVDIDLDRFVASSMPEEVERNANIAGDPVASAEFFHTFIQAILQHLFGIDVRKKSGSYKRKEGIFGKVQAYVGSVEAQGRGTLHLHMLLWLQGGPPASVMEAALKCEEFKAKVVNFIRSTISGDIGGMLKEEILAMKKEDDLSTSRPIHPRSIGYKQECRVLMPKLARQLQVHKCKTSACLRTVKGRLSCKRNAPWKVSAKAWVLGDGNWGPRRLWGYVNNYNEVLLQNLRCNHDVKLITNAGETKSVAWYMAIYATKKKKPTNASAMMARAHAFSATLDSGEHDIRKRNRKLILRCANALNRDQEFSGPEVASYLLGYGDSFLSHHYVPIYWDSCMAALFKSYPDLHSAR
jgi:hypothetical protein